MQDVGFRALGFSFWVFVGLWALGFLSEVLKASAASVIYILYTYRSIWSSVLIGRGSCFANTLIIAAYSMLKGCTAAKLGAVKSPPKRGTVCRCYPTSPEYLDKDNHAALRVWAFAFRVGRYSFKTNCNTNILNPNARKVGSQGHKSQPIHQRRALEQDSGCWLTRQGLRGGRGVKI